MSMLQAALSTKRTIEDVIQIERNLKQRTNDEWIPIGVVVIQIRSGSDEQLRLHRTEC